MITLQTINKSLFFIFKNNYPGASLVCQDHDTSEFYLAGVVIGKSRCKWMLINTPKLHASIEDHLKTIQ